MKLRESEKHQLKDKIDDLQSEVINLKQECSNFVKKHNDDLDLISILRKQQDSVKSERSSLEHEIT